MESSVAIYKPMPGVIFHFGCGENSTLVGAFADVPDTMLPNISYAQARQVILSDNLAMLDHVNAHVTFLAKFDEQQGLLKKEAEKLGHFEGTGWSMFSSLTSMFVWAIAGTFFLYLCGPALRNSLSACTSRPKN